MAAEMERGPLPAAGSILRPVHSVRNMKCFLVTESELQQIGLANIGLTASVGIGSALIAFGIDIMKDRLIEGEMPSQTAALIDALEPVAFGGGLVFYVLAYVIFRWRRGMLATIKSESQETSSAPTAAPGVPAARPVAPPESSPAAA